MREVADRSPMGNETGNEKVVWALEIAVSMSVYLCEGIDLLLTDERFFVADSLTAVIDIVDLALIARFIEAILEAPDR